MSKAPKQRKAQLHYQPYQASSASSNGDGSGLDFHGADLPMMDPVLAGFSSNLSRNLWDDWNESDPNLVKFDMFTDDGSSMTATNTRVTQTMTQGNVSMHQEPMHPMAASQQAHGETSHHVDHHSVSMSAGSGSFEPMELDSARHASGGFSAQMQGLPRMHVKRSLSEDIVSMLDDETQDPFGHHARAQTKAMQQQQQHRQHYTPTSSAQNKTSEPMNTQESLMVQNSTAWMSGFAQEVPVQGPPSPRTQARIDAHNSRPEPTPLERAAAAIATTMVAVPNPCKEKEAPPAPEPSASSTATSNVMTPSPFNAFSFMSAAIEGKADGSDGKNGDKNVNMFGNQGMMMPGFMMYSMPMMGNYQAAAAAMGMMPMGMPMGAMQMSMGMPMNPMGMAMGPMGAMQMPMGMPMMPMNPMGMQMNPMGMAMTPNGNATADGNAGTLSANSATAPGATTPANGTTPDGLALLKGKPLIASKDPRGPGFVSIARKPEEPEVSTILKSLMEEEAKKKEKKLERNRDSARESRKKQQTYVETLETGIKRLQINRDLVHSYRWGVTGPSSLTLASLSSTSPGNDTHNRNRELVEWKTRVNVVTGASESFSNLQNPAGFQSLMRVNRQRRALGFSRDEKERAIWKCFVCVGKQLAALRQRILELQVFRTLETNPLTADLRDQLQLTEQQRLALQCHSNRIFAQEVEALVKLFKVFFALRDQALRFNLLSPSLEQYFRETCAMDQLQRLLQWTETYRSTIQDTLSLQA
ncbi:hypothetical protein Poli38472_001517 [Pythium oligandrum]|uniref:BZIP domain-containing protein n=1 Tax=Pythium oligandrum TaxID=41045 RepID=A0A8K1FNG4_PYTOL|nr:hypothetical protein Poli38472_001517 [Pythium oligandrum]|eukprot:TMW69361.1 hypothetical protein Poli38472_001517 [Pythium oligandrum]